LEKDESRFVKKKKKNESLKAHPFLSDAVSGQIETRHAASSWLCLPGAVPGCGIFFFFEESGGVKNPCSNY